MQAADGNVIIAAVHTAEILQLQIGVRFAGLHAQRVSSDDHPAMMRAGCRRLLEQVAIKPLVQLRQS